MLVYYSCFPAWVRTKSKWVKATRAAVTLRGNKSYRMSYHKKLVAIEPNERIELSTTLY